MSNALEKGEVSSYTYFAEYCRGKNLTRKRISVLFSGRVDKEDYDRLDRTAIIDFLVGLSNL